MRREVKDIQLAFSAVVLVLFCSGTQAQQKAFDTIQVNVITRFKPTIHDAVKLNTNPAVADSVCLSRNVKYDVINTQYPTTYSPPQIPAMQLKAEPPERLYHSLLEAGIGNYNTLYGEYFFNSIRSHDMDWGIHLNHLSSQYTTNNFGVSDYAFNNVDAYGEKIFNEHIITAQAGFENHILHDYGYNISENFITDQNVTRESFDLFCGSLDLASQYRDSSKIGHEVKLNYYDFTDLYGASENNFGADMKFFTYFNQQRIDLKAKFNYFGDDNRAGNSSNYDILLNPFFTTNERHWDAHLGANVYFDPMDKKANVYPDLVARYHIAQDVVMIFAGIDGNETFNSYKSLSDRNQFVQDTLKLHYTYTQFHVYGGLAGNITSQLTYNVTVAQSLIKNMPLFVTDTLEVLKNRFAVVYDNVKVMSFHGDMDYTMKNNLSILLAGDYTMYTPTNQLKAWYNPALRISATGKYTYMNKYIFKAEFFVVGSQFAPEMVDGIMTAKTLSGYPDLNLGVDYKYNKTFTAFLNLNNIANVAYYSWDNYEMQRFNFLIGVRLGF